MRREKRNFSKVPTREAAVLVSQSSFPTEKNQVKHFQVKNTATNTCRTKDSRKKESLLLPPSRYFPSIAWDFVITLATMNKFWFSLGRRYEARSIFVGRDREVVSSMDPLSPSKHICYTRKQKRKTVVQLWNTNRARMMLRRIRWAQNELDTGSRFLRLFQISV